MKNRRTRAGPKKAQFKSFEFIIDLNQAGLGAIGGDDTSA